MKRKFDRERFGKLIKVMVIGWVILWLGLSVFGFVGYSTKGCQSIQKEYNEQLSNFKKDAEVQEKKRAELIIEFEKSYPKPEGRLETAEEFLLKEKAKEEYLKQNGINLELFSSSGKLWFPIRESVFEKEHLEITAQKNYCTGAGYGAAVGLVFSITVLILYLSFLYLFPKTEVV